MSSHSHAAASPKKSTGNGFGASSSKGSTVSASPGQPGQLNDGAAAAISFPFSSGPFRLQHVDSSAVRVHKRSGGKAVGMPAGVDVYRAVLDIPFEGTPDLDAFQASLTTPEARVKCEAKITATGACASFPLTRTSPISPLCRGPHGGRSRDDRDVRSPHSDQSDEIQVGMAS